MNNRERAELLAIRIAKIQYDVHEGEPENLIVAEIEKELAASPPAIPDEAKNMFRDADRKKFAAIEWDVEDWKIFYECQGFAMWRIMQRKRQKKGTG